MELLQSSLESMVRIMEASALSAMEVQTDGWRIRLEKPVEISTVIGRADRVMTLEAPPEAAAVGIIGEDVSGVTLVTRPAQSAPVQEQAPKAPAAQERKGSKELKSPMVGTFHFLKGKQELVGKRFKKGEPVCTIEAMKLMNEIIMEEDGEIAWVALADGDMVEYGQLILTFE